MKITYVALIEEIALETDVDKKTVRKIMDSFIEKVKKFKENRR